MGKLNDDEIDKKVIEYTKTLTDTQKEAFNRIAGTTGTRSYVKKSNSNLKKAFSKIKKNVQKAYPKEGDSSGFEKPDKEESRDFELPKPKKEKKPVEKKLDVVLGKKQTQPQLPKKIKRKLTVEKKKQELKAPSGREYSRIELREGLGSKRAKEWRKKNKIPVNDFKLSKPKKKSKKVK